MSSLIDSILVIFPSNGVFTVWEILKDSEALQSFMPPDKWLEELSSEKGETHFLNQSHSSKPYLKSEHDAQSAELVTCAQTQELLVMTSFTPLN